MVRREYYNVCRVVRDLCTFRPYILAYKVNVQEEEKVAGRDGKKVTRRGRK